MLSKEASAMFSKNPFIPARETMIAMCEATAMTVRKQLLRTTVNETAQEVPGRASL